MAFQLHKKDAAPKMTAAQAGRFLALKDSMSIACKPPNKIAYGLLMAGKKVPGRKLVKARSNREWKSDAETPLVRKFGNDAMTRRELKSPSKIEELVGGAAMTARHAFKPDKGLTVARADDKRTAVDRNPSRGFTDVTKKGKKK